MLKTKAARLFLLVSISLLLGVGHAGGAVRKFSVRGAGAVGDGRADDRAAIQKAIDAAAGAGGGEVDFPDGTYLSGSIELKSHVTLNLAKGARLVGSPDADDYPIAPARWEGIERPCHQALIRANGAEDIAIIGAGAIEGDSNVGRLRDPRGPAIVEPISCRNVRVEGVTLRSVGIWTLHPTYCQDVTISHITFDTTGWNSDGIDPDSCRRVLIDNCVFSTGDDNIAIKSGKGREGVEIGRPCEDITITNCTFLKGISSIALGSELSGGIRRVTVSHCTFRNGHEALLLKSRPGRAGYIQGLRASHLVVGPGPLLRVLTTYSANPDAQGVPGGAGLTRFSDINISDVQADSQDLVIVEATPDRPVDGLTLSNITGRCTHGLVLHNVRNAVMKNIRLRGLTGPLYLTENVQGVGLEEGAPSPQVTP